MLTPSGQPHDASEIGVRTRYVARYEKNPEIWPRLGWVNLYSHEALAREAGTLRLENLARYLFDWEARARVVKMITPDGKRVTPETRGLLVPMHVVATEILQTGRETVDSEPVDVEEMDWRDVHDEGGTGDPASTEMRHQIFEPVGDPVNSVDSPRSWLRWVSTGTGNSVRVIWNALKSDR